MSKHSCFFLLLCLIASVAWSRDDLGNYVVVRGRMAYLWCRFNETTRFRSVFQTSNSKKMVYSPRFSSSVSHDSVVWSEMNNVIVDHNPRHSKMYHLYVFSLNISDVRFEDAGRYACADENSMIITAFNLIVTGESFNFEKTFDDHDNLDDDHTYVVQKGKPIKFICSLAISRNPWEGTFPILTIDDGVVSNNKTQNYSVVYTFTTIASKSKECKCRAVFPDDVLSSIEPSTILLLVNDTENSTVNEQQVVRYGAIQGESLVLSCMSFYPQNNNWKWYRGMDFDTFHFGLPIIECIMTSQNECYNISSSREYIDSSTQSYSLLKFPHLDFESAGLYSCVDSLFTVQKTFEVIVIENRPFTMMVNHTLVSHEATVDFKKGQNVFITCSMRYHPGHGHDHHPKLIVMDSQHHNYTMANDSLTYVYSAIINEPKSYICYVELPEGFQFYQEPRNYTFHTNVFHCPEALTISGNMSHNAIQRGGILNCVVSSVPPVIVMLKSSSHTPHFISGPNFDSIRVFNRESFVCETQPTSHILLGICSPLYASIGIYHVINATRTKTIKAAVIQGKSFKLSCRSYHLRNNNWKWFRDWNQSSLQVNVPIVDCIMNENKKCINTSTQYQDSSTHTFSWLSFQNATLNDTGSYKCIDSLLTVQKTFELSVLGCPENMIISKINWDEPFGKGKELLCNVVANPPVNVSWSFLNRSLISISGLNSARIGVVEKGMYECTANLNHHRVLGTCSRLSARVVVEDEVRNTQEIED